MFLILLILISGLAFLSGLSLGRATIPKTKHKKTVVSLETDDYKNFLNYDGNIQ